jgi:alcohol dehydrogenase (cytochrome c)
VTRRHRFHATVATSALVLALWATVAAAQRPAAPQPKPETPPPVPSILQNYKSVTADRLKQPEDSDWLMYRRTYDSWG